MWNAIGTLACLLTIQLPPAPQSASDLTSGLRAERQAIRVREAERLRGLAERLAGEGKASEANAVRDLIEPEPSPDGPSRFKPLPEVSPGRGTGQGQGLASLPASGPDAKAPASAQPIRAEAASALFDLAQKSAASKRFALADECLRAVLDRQPDHAEARRLLDFIPYQGGWATPYAVERFKAGDVLHPTYGWVPADWVPHLDQGELPAPTRSKGQRPTWLPAQQADDLRRQWSRGWQITTEHFQIQTNVPMSEAIAFARQLEHLHDLFFSLMADLIGEERLPLAHRFKNSKRPSPFREKPHLVSYFADKAEFVAHLSPKLGPDIADSLGVYIMPKEARQLHQPPSSYFFRDLGGELPVEATLYHEVSHQLLFESAGEGKIDQNVGNYWVFEGLGTYFETLTSHKDGTLEVGGLVGPRIEVARDRLVTQKEFIPLEQFVAMSKPVFSARTGGDVHLNYAEAMALAVFLMQHDREAYRDDFLEYAHHAFKGRLRRNTTHALDAQLGVSYARLDAQFLDFLKGKEAKEGRGAEPPPSSRGEGDRKANAGS